MFSIFGVTDHTQGILDRYVDGHFCCAAVQDCSPTKKLLLDLQERLRCEFPAEFIAHSTGLSAVLKSR
ncbi:MAG: hypothetical protein WBX15_00220 [Thermoanaerobaculia bacterium]